MSSASPAASAILSDEGAMRIQLQQQSGGRTIHHGSRVLRAIGGVTTQQLVAALLDLRQRGAIPRREQPQANAALANAMKWIDMRPPEGVSGRFSKSFYFNPANPGKSWRFDIEGLSGYNLRQ
jgi:hypothetical protein